MHVEADEPILVSAKVSKEVVAELGLMGHKVTVLSGLGGPANVVVIDPSGESIAAASTQGPDGVAGR